MWIYTSLHCFIVKPYTTLLHTHISKSQKLIRTLLVIQGSHQRPDSHTKAIENTIQMAPKLFLATQHHSPPHAIYHTEQRHIQPHQSTTQMRVSRVRPPSNGDPRALVGQGCNGMEHTCAVKKKFQAALIQPTDWSYSSNVNVTYHHRQGRQKEVNQTQPHHHQAATRGH